MAALARKDLYYLRRSWYVGQSGARLGRDLDDGIPYICRESFDTWASTPSLVAVSGVQLLNDLSESRNYYQPYLDCRNEWETDHRPVYDRDIDDPISYLIALWVYQYGSWSEARQFVRDMQKEHGDEVVEGVADLVYAVQKRDHIADPQLIGCPENGLTFRCVLILLEAVKENHKVYRAPDLPLVKQQLVATITVQELAQGPDQSRINYAENDDIKRHLSYLTDNESQLMHCTYGRDELGAKMQTVILWFGDMPKLKPDPSEFHFHPLINRDQGLPRDGYDECPPGFFEAKLHGPTPRKITRIFIDDIEKDYYYIIKKAHEEEAAEATRVWLAEKEAADKEAAQARIAAQAEKDAQAEQARQDAMAARAEKAAQDKKDAEAARAARAAAVQRRARSGTRQADDSTSKPDTVAIIATSAPAVEATKVATRSSRTQPVLDVEAAQKFAKNVDILGIKLGMLLIDAETIVRDHMSLAAVYELDQKTGMPPYGAAPFGRFRVYFAAGSKEVITLSFEHSDAGGRELVGIWRSVKFQQRAELEALQNSIKEKYGNPSRAVGQLTNWGSPGAKGQCKVTAMGNLKRLAKGSAELELIEGENLTTRDWGTYAPKVPVMKVASWTSLSDRELFDECTAFLATITKQTKLEFTLANYGRYFDQFAALYVKEEG